MENNELTDLIFEVLVSDAEGLTSTDTVVYSLTANNDPVVVPAEEPNFSNTNITTIKTSQAPDAKPIAINLVLSTEWQILIDVPNYEVPELVFGGSTTIESGVGEVISPLLCTNVTDTPALIDVRVYRNVDEQHYYFVKNLSIPSYDMVPIPMNGQFFKTGDILEIRSEANSAINTMLSYTLGQSEEDDV